MHVLNKFFDKVYCINLEHRTDRWKKCTKEFERIGLDVERIEAINGHTCGLQASDPPKNWMKMRAGGVGCALSHVKILKRAKAEGFKNVLALEDDIEFCENFNEEIAAYLPLVPNDWDVIYVGGNHTPDSRIGPPQDMGGFLKCIFTQTTHFIATNHTIYDLIIQEALKLNMVIDLVYAVQQQKINAYSSLKKLAWQVDGYSDIEDKVVSYTILRD